MGRWVTKHQQWSLPLGVAYGVFMGLYALMRGGPGSGLQLIATAQHERDAAVAGAIRTDQLKVQTDAAVAAAQSRFQASTPS